MAKYKILVELDALQDIQEATDWYNEQLKGLGSKFQKQVVTRVNSLKKNPLGYAIRYADVRCVLVKKFPFMVHFTINEKKNLVEVFAVYHTSRNPKIWEERKPNNS
jgi:mRNA-degrading endonuclease RelE of RelBE toxin-antitoxin system